MDQSLDNKNNTKDKLLSFFKKNKYLFITFIFVIIVCISIYLILNENKKKENLKLSEKYIKSRMFLSNDKPDEALIGLEEIIFNGNRFYSLLAINTILEKNLIKDNEKMIKYFKKLESKNFSDEYNDLILFKKALYLINISKEISGKKILQKLIEKDSSLKSLASEIIN
tara:strand:+ start:3833 stop:4339 length:507 start_codon:yes stop_codon:yes gene_type:complete